MLDLKKHDYNSLSEAGYEFEIQFPTGELSGAFIKVRGENSPVVKQYARKKYNEFEAKRQAMKRRGKDIEDSITIEEAEDAVVESMVVRVIGWRGISDGGKELEFNQENCAKLLREHEWIRKQVKEASEDIQNFRPK